MSIVLEIVAQLTELGLRARQGHFAVDVEQHKAYHNHQVHHYAAHHNGMTAEDRELEVSSVGGAHEVNAVVRRFDKK